MPERTLTRIGAAAAVLGAVLGLVVNVLHPRVNDPANTKAFLRQVAESTIWRYVNTPTSATEEPPS